MSTTAQTVDRESRHIVKGSVRAIRSADGKSDKLGGHAAVYNQRSEWLGWFFEEIAPGAFSRAIKGVDDVRYLIDHDSGRVLGRNRAKTLTLTDDTAGLGFELSVPDTQEGRDHVISVDRGDISQMSFGFYCLQDEWREEKRDDGSTYYVRRLIEVELFDISAVAYPAYPQTDIAKRRLEQRNLTNPSIVVPTPNLRASRVAIAERRLKLLGP
ncbi:MAG: HK97 family phage prohead protease [Phycisphaerales bacterium]|nr:HK97 family phage prohead protease [Phycisphaerales bacterium]